MVAVKGCHLVGSVPLPDAESVFKQCSQGLPQRLTRIPDGETGKRNWFTFWQAGVFAVSPNLLTTFVNNAPIERNDFTEDELKAGVEQLKAARPLRTGYDDVAVESYAVFKQLRDSGVINQGTRFLVALPTTANVLGPFVQFAFQASVEPIYEEALFQSIRRLQDAIPHGDLSVQIDLAVDTMFWEGYELYRPWFPGNIDEVRTYIVNYIVRMLEQFDEDVDVGLHNCYGDMEHRHWAEPTSLAAIVERGLRVIAQSKKKPAFIHLPVPLSAIDNLDHYFAPLAELVPKLTENHTELIIGCVHYDNLAATQKMIDAAKRVPGIPDFSVSTECGMGRTPPEQLEGILQISTEVSEPVL